jgi:site-specific recombinase XerD
MGIRAERAVLPDDDRIVWVIVEDPYRLHEEGSSFLASLRDRDQSINTERTYAGRVALYLRWCEDQGVDWRPGNVRELARFLRWLVNEPLAPRGRRSTEPRFRKKKTANAVITAVIEFLKFCSKQGWVDKTTVDLLMEPKYLTWMPPGMEEGEEGQFRNLRSRVLKFTVGEEAIDWLTSEEVELLVEAADHARDKFLISLLSCTGIRIGEALGLRREDMHLLADSRLLGCQVTGPHIHIRRRAENANGALAKSRMPRSIPVTPELVALYTEYQYERDAVPEAAQCDLVFVNLFHAPLGRPMRYGSAKELFDRLAVKLKVVARPHMVRHGTCTAWIRAGVDHDVVSNLMGHVSLASLQPYTHATDDDKRQALKQVAEWRRM